MKVKAVQVPSMFDYYVLKSFKVNGTVRNKNSFEWFLEVGGFDKGNTWEHLRLMLNFNWFALPNNWGVSK